MKINEKLCVGGCHGVQFWNFCKKICFWSKKGKTIQKCFAINELNLGFEPLTFKEIFLSSELSMNF